jgi:HEAT repeat protein
MKRSSVSLVAFLSVPLLILALAIVRHQGGYRAVAIDTRFNQIKTGEQSPALVAVQELGGAVVPTLRKRLKSQDISDRIKAAWVLGQLGPVASNAIPDLIMCLDDPVNNLPIFAIQSLEAIAPAQVDAVPKLLSKLSDANEGVSNCAADLLGMIEKERKARNLRMSSDDYEYDMAFVHASALRVRLIGLERLMRLSSSDERALRALKLLSNDSNAVVRERCAILLSRP